MSQDPIKVEVDEDLEELIPSFLENRRTDVSKLTDELNSLNYESLRSIGHSLKGVGGGYGFDLMSQIGAEIETAAKENNSGLIKDKIEQLDDYLNRIVIEYI